MAVGKDYFFSFILRTHLSRDSKFNATNVFVLNENRKHMFVVQNLENIQRIVFLNDF